MLTEIEISNFRGFGRGKFSGLGMVNLIVGRNNVGKTSFLEAVRAISMAQNNADLAANFRMPQQHHGLKWLVRDGVGVENAQISARDSDNIWSTVSLSRTHQPKPAQGFELRAWDGVLNFSASKGRKPKRTCTISVYQRHPNELVAPFTDATRSGEGEGQLEALLNAVDPRIRAVRLSVSGSPEILVDIGLSERVPLTQMGQGVYRLMGIFSELLGKRPEIAFIDEIENGIYHGALTDVWKGIALVSERLDVQVFATTHSWECIVSAHQAFLQRPKYNLRIIQLYRVDDRTEGRVLDQDLIQSGIEGNIDLR